MTKCFTKRINLFGDYLSEKYRTSVLKLPINAGMSCPNRDGTLDYTGCIFCCENGSAAASCSVDLSITEQMKSAIESFKRGKCSHKYIAYFQAYTNTYADCSLLKKMYDEAVNYSPDIIGLMIGTRPDCINKENSQLISSYSNKLPEVWVELGMQSANDKSLLFLNRHHSHEDSIKAANILKNRGIKVCAHFITGIPYENYEDILHSVSAFNEMKIDGIKLHHFHVIKNTPAEKMYQNDKFNLLSMNEYISITCDIIERLNPEISVHRLSADRDIDSLIAPVWGLHKGSVQKGIEDELERRGTWQGFLFERGI